MSNKKGTILKIKNNLAIIMTSDCKIVSIRKQPGMYAGLEISFNEKEIVYKRSKINFASGIVAGLAAVFIIMFIFFNSFNSYGAYAYVTIDSDTSIEFELDKNNKVRKVNYFNDGANELLKESELKDKYIDVAIREVIEKFNLRESTVLISACLKEGKNKPHAKTKKESQKFSKLIDICKNAVEDSISEDAQSKVVGVSYDYKRLADANKTSIGRTIIYEKAKEQKVDLDIEEIKTKSIGETLEKVKIDDVGVVYDVKKVKKPALKPEKKDSLKPKPHLKKEEKDPKPVVEAKDKHQEKLDSEKKDKVEERPLPKPKNNDKEKTEPEEKAGPKEKVKEKDETEPEGKADPKEKEKGKEEEPGAEEKTGPKEKEKGKGEEPGVEEKTDPKEKVKGKGEEPGVEEKTDPKKKERGKGEEPGAEE